MERLEDLAYKKYNTAHLLLMAAYTCVFVVLVVEAEIRAVTNRSVGLSPTFEGLSLTLVTRCNLGPESVYTYRGRPDLPPPPGWAAGLGLLDKIMGQ